VSERIDRLKALTGAEQAMALFHLAVTQPGAVDAALDFLDDMLLDAVRQAAAPHLTETRQPS
jgi:hypothetical protein